MGRLTIHVNHRMMLVAAFSASLRVLTGDCVMPSQAIEAETPLDTFAANEQTYL